MDGSTTDGRTNGRTDEPTQWRMESRARDQKLREKSLADRRQETKPLFWLWWQEPEEKNENEEEPREEDEEEEKEEKKKKKNMKKMGRNILEGKADWEEERRTLKT